MVTVMWCSKLCSAIDYIFIIAAAAIAAVIPAGIGMLFLYAIVEAIALMIFPEDAVFSFMHDHQLLLFWIYFGICWVLGFLYALVSFDT